MSINDPFDEAPLDAGVDGKENVVDKEVEGDISPKRRVNDEGKIVLTFKEGAGFDSSWTVVHAASVADAAAILSDPEFKALLIQQKKVAAYFRGAAAVAATPVNRSAPSSGAPAGAQEPPAWAPPKPFPDFVYKSGISQKTGKPWQAWMAPERDDGRPALFFNPPR